MAYSLRLKRWRRVLAINADSVQLYAAIADLRMQILGRVHVGSVAYDAFSVDTERTTLGVPPRLLRDARRW